VRPYATSVCGRALLVYEALRCGCVLQACSLQQMIDALHVYAALSYSCMRPYANSVCGLAGMLAAADDSRAQRRATGTKVQMLTRCSLQACSLQQMIDALSDPCSAANASVFARGELAAHAETEDVAALAVQVPPRHTCSLRPHPAVAEGLIH
jgi:hypothetical protein